MHEYYASPLAERYASPEMLKIFSLLNYKIDRDYY